MSQKDKFINRLFFGKVSDELGFDKTMSLLQESTNVIAESYESLETKEYIVLFELYGKKLKTTVKAVSQEDAKEIIQNKIIFHKVKEKDVFDIMNDINKIIDK